MFKTAKRQVLRKRVSNTRLSNKQICNTTTKPNRSAFVKNDNFLPEHGLKLMLQLKKPKHNEADR